MEEAERVDAKVAAKAASDMRRQKYREREIVAGRMKVISLDEIFRNSATKSNGE